MRKRAVLHEVIGHVGIDAGLLYLGDPCYFVERPIGKGPWARFYDRYIKPAEDAETFLVDQLTANRAALGVMVRTGYGDGCYPVEVTYADDGRVASVKVTFIDEEAER